MGVGGCLKCGGAVSRTSTSGLCRKCWIRPVPPDFADRAGEMCPAELMRHYAAAECAIMRWTKETGARARSRAVTVPCDLAANARVMGVMQLSRHYGRSGHLIRCWLNGAGLIALKNPPRPRADYAPRKVARPQPFIWKGQRIPPIPGRDGSLHGSAAEHLRRYAAVYRCQERGRADPNGEFYRYGNTVLTPDELLIRAKRRGWEMVA